MLPFHNVTIEFFSDFLKYNSSLKIIERLLKTIVFKLQTRTLKFEIVMFLSWAIFKKVINFWKFVNMLKKRASSVQNYFIKF